jgi:hypothetical protein
MGDNFISNADRAPGEKVHGRPSKDMTASESHYLTTGTFEALAANLSSMFDLL